MADPKLLELGAARLAERLRNGTLSATQLAMAVCDRIEATESTLSAFVSFDQDRFLRDAAAADEARLTDSTSLVTGLPVAVKDNIDVAGMRTAVGSRVLGHAGKLAAEDAAAVAKVRAAGAVIVGKTNLHEFAYGATGVNPRQRTPANPWDQSRIPGGSSSGSAVAVAAHQVPLAIGTDAAGSIRMPASVCGIVGLKPTFGRVSTRGLIASHNASVDHVGPLAASVEDAALGLQILAGHDAADCVSIEEPVEDYVGALGARDSLRGIHVGVPGSYFFNDVAPEVEDGVRAAIDALGQLGATLVAIDIPDMDDMMPARLALFADGLAFHLPHLRAHPELYTREIRHRLLVDTFVQAHDVARAGRVRQLMRERFARAFSDNGIHVIATPTTPIAAVPTDQWSVTFAQGPPEPVGLAMLRLTAPANLTGLPAISVPAGFTRDPELPFGLQLMARPFQESLLLQVAHVYERSTSWHLRRPTALSR